MMELTQPGSFESPTIFPGTCFTMGKLGTADTMGSHSLSRIPYPLCNPASTYPMMTAFINSHPFAKIPSPSLAVCHPRPAPQPFTLLHTFIAYLQTLTAVYLFVIGIGDYPYKLGINETYELLLIIVS